MTGVEDSRFLRHRFDMAVQTTLVPGRFVFVEETFGRHAIDNRNRSGVSGGGRVLILSLDGLGYPFNMRTQLRTLAGFKLAMVFGLSGPFSSLK